MENEIMFIGMDFVNEVPKILKEKESVLCADMTEDQIKAYYYGIETVMLLLDGIVHNAESNEVFVHIDNLECQEEFLLDELISKISGE